MKIEKLLLEIESLCEQCGYEIRKERGTFRGDQCLVEGEKLILINKNKPLETQAGILAKILYQNGIDDLYIKPLVRKHLAELWERFDNLEKD
ncbi:MAG: hypothetical protein ACFCU6_02890 [Balneolaceae bacterium]